MTRELGRTLHNNMQDLEQCLWRRHKTAGRASLARKTWIKVLEKPSAHQEPASEPASQETRKDSQRSTEHTGYQQSHHRSEHPWSAGGQPHLKPTQMQMIPQQRPKTLEWRKSLLSRLKGMYSGFRAQSLENTHFWEKKCSPRKQQYGNQERQQQRLDGEEA